MWRGDHASNRSDGLKGEPGVYHVISRTALAGFVLGDIEKDFLLNLIRRLSRVYFAEVLGFCLMGNHFHLLVRMHPGENQNDEEIKRRLLPLLRKGNRHQ
jgi:putative transposase